LGEILPGDEKRREVSVAGCRMRAQAHQQERGEANRDQQRRKQQAGAVQCRAGRGAITPGPDKVAGQPKRFGTPGPGGSGFDHFHQPPHRRVAIRGRDKANEHRPVLRVE
jgi:hypothetical protein